MARPRHVNPTPAEFEVLEFIWDNGPSTVREVMTALNEQRPRAYTSVMSLMNVMAEKDLLTRRPKGRAYIYDAKVTRTKTQSKMLKDLVSQVFDGSASALVTHLLHKATPNSEELEEIRKTLAEFRRKEGGK